MASEQNQQQSFTSSPPLCENGCGYYGNQTTRNLCSKCYGSYMADQTRQAQRTATSPMDGAVADADPSPESVATGVPEAPLPAIPPPGDASSPVPNSEVSAAGAEEADQKPERPIQENKSRCWTCKKRVGLLGFPCRCGYTFCDQHRYSDTHSCDFDYMSYDREQLSRNNQKVVAEKIEKI